MSSAAAISAAAVGLSPRMRVDSTVVVRGDAAGSLLRSRLGVTVVSFDDEELDDDVLGVGADGLDGACAGLLSEDDEDDELAGAWADGAALG